MGRIGRTWFQISQRLGIGPRSGIGYWERRTRLLGPEAVLNSALDDSTAITAVQERVVLPVFAGELNGSEELIVDFGSGPGRFTSKLAQLGGCRVIGVDPILALVEAAPQAPGVTYEQVVDGRIPVQSGSADAVFVCEVLGAITDDGDLAAAGAEIDRVLSPGGLLLLSESESGSTGASHWRDRSLEDYAALMDFADLRRRAEYDDGGHNIVVMTGRRKPPVRPT